MASRRDVVVVGASAGGVEALRALARGLPADLEATIFVVLHLGPGGPSTLPGILSRVGAIPARHPAEEETHAPFRPGTMYVAPPNRQMVIDGDRVVTVMPAEGDRFCPSIDALFESAARFHGPGVIGVILTGALDDGTSGLAAVKRQGGLAVVQDPADALFPSMPKSAMRHVAVDHCVPMAEIPGLLARLTREELAGAAVEVPAKLGGSSRARHP